LNTTIAADQRDLIRDGIRESSQPGRTSRRVVKVKNARLFFAEDRPHAQAKRRLAVILHRIWVDGAEFRWTREVVTAV
jgi:hypothetical protein